MFTVGIIGRPNVGKSTLFNRIAGKKLSIVDDRPGVTRDRVEITTSWDSKVFKLVDTAGFDLKEDIMKKEMQAQFLKAIELADFLLIVVSQSDGVHSLDEIVIEMLRKKNKKFIVVVNKVDSESKSNNMGEFYSLGKNIELFGISALHGRNVDEVLDYIAEQVISDEEEINLDDRIKVAVVGRPNVGKSSLVNAWLNEERVIVTDIAGTTRDSIDTLFEYNGLKFVLTDTAGIRKKSVMFKDDIEKYGYYRTIDSIERSDIVVSVIDATDMINERDVKVIAKAWQSYKPVILVVTKWDLILKKESSTQMKKIKSLVLEKLQFLNNPPIIFTSSVSKNNIYKIFNEANRLYESYSKRITTSKVNEIMEEAVSRHQAPTVHNKRLKFFYMTQVSTKPPYFVAFVNYPKAVHFSYKRFILNLIRERFGFDGVPIKLGIRAKGRKEIDDR